MSSDDIKPRVEKPVSIAGPGLPYTFRCARCQQPMRNYGRRKERVNGLMQFVGKCCQKQEVQA